MSQSQSYRLQYAKTGILNPDAVTAWQGLSALALAGGHGSGRGHISLALLSHLFSLFTSLLTSFQLLFSRTHYAPIYTRNTHWYVEIGRGSLRDEKNEEKYQVKHVWTQSNY
ncbi:hypothetical protein L873DRAFT_1801170 [Choiromyces venosus 120613-1]|uniref:Uncharacterized protein n=1 Tax=Choiromyces venosus 120613-1 TaxID=1336337 RepID=A0A3N4K3W1_9PEZI|nr:hypothetical protein L873DRAFT_1801170 [Choiromyces venosus 120613-1]